MFEFIWTRWLWPVESTSPVGMCTTQALELDAVADLCLPDGNAALGQTLHRLLVRTDVSHRGVLKLPDFEPGACVTYTCIKCGYWSGVRAGMVLQLCMRCGKQDEIYTSFAFVTEIFR